MKDFTYEQALSLAMHRQLAALGAEEAERYYANGGTRKEKPPLGPLKIALDDGRWECSKCHQIIELGHHRC